MKLSDHLSAWFILLFIAVVVGFWGAVAYIALHFITKFW